MRMKPTLILLHGALGSKDQLTSIKEFLNPHFEVYDFNFSGHGGKRFGSTPFTIEGFSNEFSQFLEENNFTCPYIFGYSMGGYVALKLALEEPEKVKAIFTLGTKLTWSPEIALKELKMLQPEIIEEKVPKFAAVLKQRHSPNDWKEVLRKTGKLMTRLGNDEAMTPEHFRSIQIPVIIGIGELDNMVTLEESKTVAELLPNGKLETFEGFKHPIEQVDEKLLADKILLYFKETNLPH